MAASNNCANLLNPLRNSQQTLFWGVCSGRLTRLRQASIAIHRILDFPVPHVAPMAAWHSHWAFGLLACQTATPFYPRLLSSMHYYNNRPIHYNIPLNCLLSAWLEMKQAIFPPNNF